MNELDFSSAVRGNAVPDQATRGKATQNSAAGYIHIEGSEQRIVPALLVKQVDEAKRQVRVLASSGTLDRHGERILPEAFANSIDRFLANPCVLGCHLHRLGSGEPPVIGKVVKLWVDGQGLWAIIEFAVTDLAEKYWVLYRDGYMKAASIGFIPISYEDKQEDGGWVRVYTEVELLEISLVPVPSNPEALVKSKVEEQSFVDRKRQEREDDKLWAEIVAEDPDIERKCDEFADAILLGTYDNGAEVTIEEGSFVRLVSGEPAYGFADLVSR